MTELNHRLLTGKRSWQHNFLYALLFILGLNPLVAAPAKRTPVKPAPAPQMRIEMPDVLLRGAPGAAYPDGQLMTDISGTVTVIYHAGGCYTFRYKDFNLDKPLTTRVQLDLTLTVQYTRSGKSEVITTTVNGRKLTTGYAPRAGTSRHTIGQYAAEYRLRRQETYTGSTTKRYQNRAIPSLIWSKTLRLACFRARLGDAPSGWPSHMIDVPCKVQKEEVISYDGESERQTSDWEQEMLTFVPSYGTAPTRWAKLVNNVLLDNSGWIETASSQGTTNGAFTLPMYFDGISWITPEECRQTYKDPDRQPATEDMIPWKGSVQVRWALGSRMPQGKMTLTPADKDVYQSWIPTTELDQETDAEPLTFVATIQPKEEGKPAPIGRIHFWLCDVSRQKGQCTNYPLNGDEEDDLRFVPSPGITIDPANPHHAYTKKAGSEADVTVEARDTGAFGQLQATCEELGLIAEDERTGRQAIAIPLDDNHNDVADAWERQIGVSDALATNDEDAQPGHQRRDGDGYTFYEEYRGFKTLQGFKRTDPRRKDLFVYDPDGLVRKYYAPHNPAQLVLHYVDPTLMRFNGEAKNPDNRWVNVNTSEDKRYARQYALYMKQWTTMADGTVGEGSSQTLADKLNGIGTDWKMFQQPLKSIYVIKIAPSVIERSLAGIPDPNVRQTAFNLLMTSTVIHEFGHGIGIHHHAESENEKDEEICAGVIDCAMRYTSETEYQHPKLLKAQNRLCHEGESWQMTTMEQDDEGNETAHTETKPAHDCFGQVDVKSDP